MAYRPIENYGVVGDLRTLALVGNDGSVDLMCFPRFDSPTIFAALLDDKKGGRFTLAPAAECEHRKQFYLPDSAVLLTRFLFGEGVAEISDFMPVREAAPVQCLVRRAKAVRGRIHFRMVCAPRFDYARATHHVELVTANEALFVSDRLALRLRADVPLAISDGAVVADFTLEPEHSAAFVLEEARTTGVIVRVSEAFKRTNTFWHRWVARSTYRGRWREAVNRSALTLKLMTSREHGSMVAAPTFGLPEELGGSRNWDYRFTWIRDASFTLYALIRLGYTTEAADFMKWIEARCGELNPDGSLQVMYGLDGRHNLDEEELPHLEGYMGSHPVRIGNNAYRQLQLDIYGELMDSVYLYNKFGAPISNDLWANLVRLVDYVCRNWRMKDEGIWETRSGRQPFTLSNVMCWVAVDRAIRLSDKRSFPAPLADWHRTRDEIYHHIFDGCWNPKVRAFTTAAGSEQLDAATLLMPLMRFIAPTDPRWLSTLKALEHELVQDSHVFRYPPASDGLPGSEGSFNMCSFWYVEALARGGNVESARFIFEKTLGYANHLGLFSEELGARGEALGNFPQAFSHIAMISAAYLLDKVIDQSRVER